MENSPKKSKALIITIILIIILILVGYFLFKNRNVTSTSSGLISKIFAPLLPSDNTKKTTAQAGEDVKKGDRVYVASSDSNGNSIVMKVDNSGASSGKVLGTAAENISNGDFGQIILDTSGGSNNFLNSFSVFINDLFNGGNGEVPPPGGGDITPPGGGDITPPGGGDITPPGGGDITPPGGGDITPPGGTIFQCGDTLDNDSDGFIDILDPNCHLDGDLTKIYVPTHNNESSSPTTLYQCNDGIDNDIDGFIDIFDRGCHMDWDLEKVYVPTHNYELDLGGTTDEKLPDLKAGTVKPTITTLNTATTISSIITNDGDGSTEKSFSVLFTLKKESNNIDEEETEPTVSKSSVKNLLSKIFNKIPFISKVNAATPTVNTSNVVGDIETDGLEISITLPTLSASTGGLATISHVFTSVGIYSIRACADKNSVGDAGTIIESNEDNNCGPWVTLTVSGSLPPPPGEDTTECSDEIDNDIDNFTDELDPNCHLDGDLTKDYIPTHNDESSSPSSSSYECSDNTDNDSDGKIDEDDPNCYLDSDLEKEYLPTHDDELSSTTSGNEVNKCKLIEQNPLEFTTEEKARLAVLLRKFYLISSTLKTTDDIITIYNEIDQQENFMSEIDGLTKQCYLETNDSSGFSDFCKRNPELCDINYTSEFASETNYGYSSYGNTKHGNPWYTKTSGGTFPYDASDYVVDRDGKKTYFGYTNYNWLEPYNELSNTWGPNHDRWGGEACKVVSGYYYGTGTHPSGGSYDCNTLNTFPEYGLCNAMSTDITNGGGGPNETYLNEGCKWKDGVFLEDTERILNIW